MGFLDWVDAAVATIPWAIGKGVEAVGSLTDSNTLKAVGEVQAAPIKTTATAAQALMQPDTPQKPAVAPLPPTPSDPATAAAMNNASYRTRQPSGLASTYLANDPTLLDQPGTFFKSSLGR